MLEPDYCKARLLEIEVGRSFWQSTASPKNALNFYARVVKPLRQLQRRGVVEKLQKVTATGLAKSRLRPCHRPYFFDSAACLLSVSSVKRYQTRARNLQKILGSVRSTANRKKVPNARL